MKKNMVYELIENSLNSNKNAYIRYLNEFVKELRIEGYNDMHDNIKNIIDKNVYVEFSLAKDNKFLNVIKNEKFEIDMLIKGIDMKIIKSVLFYGSPGTGKTFFAKEVSELTNYKFIKFSILDFIDFKLGESIRKLETFMKKNISSKNIIFIDEADSLFTKRGRKNDVFEMERVLTTMLQIMDMNREAVIIFATNLKKQIDPAILRRFDMQINFDDFDINVRKALKQSKFLNETILTKKEEEELHNLITNIIKIRISDIDLITRKYIIHKFLNSNDKKIQKKYISIIQNVIKRINLSRENKE